MRAKLHGDRHDRGRTAGEAAFVIALVIGLRAKG